MLNNHSHKDNVKMQAIVNETLLHLQSIAGKAGVCWGCTLKMLATQVGLNIIRDEQRLAGFPDAPITDDMLLDVGSALMGSMAMLLRMMENGAAHETFVPGDSEDPPPTPHMN